MLVFPRANTAITVSVETGVTLRDLPKSPNAPYFSVAILTSAFVRKNKPRLSACFAVYLMFHPFPESFQIFSVFKTTPSESVRIGGLVFESVAGAFARSRKVTGLLLYGSKYHGAPSM